MMKEHADLDGTQFQSTYGWVTSPFRSHPDRAVHRICVCRLSARSSQPGARQHSGCDRAAERSRAEVRQPFVQRLTARTEHCEAPEPHLLA